MDPTSLISIGVPAVVGLILGWITRGSNKHSVDTASADAKNATLFDAQKKLLDSLMVMVDNYQKDVAELQFNLDASMAISEKLMKENSKLMKTNEDLSDALEFLTGRRSCDSSMVSITE